MTWNDESGSEHEAEETKSGVDGDSTYLAFYSCITQSTTNPVEFARRPSVHRALTFDGSNYL